MPGEGEESGHRVAVRTVPGARDGQRPGRVGRDHLDLNALARRCGARTERVARVDDLAHALREPRVREPEVDEPGTRSLRARGDSAFDHLRRDLVRDLARRALLQARELEGDVRRVVAVLGVARTLERDGRARDLGELVGETCYRIRDSWARHAPIVGRAATGSWQNGAAVIGTTTPSRWSASCTSSRAL